MELVGAARTTDSRFMLAADVGGEKCSVRGLRRLLKIVRNDGFRLLVLRGGNSHLYPPKAIPSHVETVKESNTRDCFAIGGHPGELRAYQRRLSGQRRSMRTPTLFLPIPLHRPQLALWSLFEIDHNVLANVPSRVALPDSGSRDTTDLSLL